MPGSGCSTSELSGRIHRRFLPEESLATKANRVPSGERTTARTADLSCRTIEERIGPGKTEVRFPERSKAAPATSSAAAATVQGNSRAGRPAPLEPGSREARRGSLLHPAEFPFHVRRALPALLRVLGEAGLHDAVERRRRHRLRPGDRCGSVCRIAAISEAWLVPEKAFLPVAIS